MLWTASLNDGPKFFTLCDCVKNVSRSLHNTHFVLYLVTVFVFKWKYSAERLPCHYLKFTAAFKPTLCAQFYAFFVSHRQKRLPIRKTMHCTITSA